MGAVATATFDSGAEVSSHRVYSSRFIEKMLTVVAVLEERDCAP